MQVQRLTRHTVSCHTVSRHTVSCHTVSRHTVWATPAALAAFLALSACHLHDLGTECALDRQPFDNKQTEWVVGEVPIITEEQIIQDGTCETFICLNHDGIPPYCSRHCSDNQPCPDAFECKQVQGLGPRSNDTYCVYAVCETDADCRDIKTYACVTFESTGLDPTATLKRCQLIQPDEPDEPDEQ